MDPNADPLRKVNGVTLRKVNGTALRKAQAALDGEHPPLVQQSPLRRPEAWMMQTAPGFCSTLRRIV